MNDLGPLVRTSIERHAAVWTAASMPEGTRLRVAVRGIVRVAAGLMVAVAFITAGAVSIGVTQHHSRTSPAEPASGSPSWPDVRIGAGTASVPWEPVPERVDQQIAPWEAIAHGTTDGVAWTLSADREYLMALVDNPQSTDDWRQPGSCAVLSINDGWQEATSCLAPQLGEMMAESQHRWVQGRQVSAYAIAVLPDVASVEIRLDDGQSRQLPIFHGSDALDAMRFTVAFPPVGTTGKIVALDDRGSVLQAVAFCVPVVNGPSEDGASCPGNYPSDG